MIASIVIGAIILLYSGLVIYKRVKDMKAGKFCSCSSESCSGCSRKKIS